MKVLLRVAVCLLLTFISGCRGCTKTRKFQAAWTQARKAQPNPRQFLVRFAPGTSAGTIRDALGEFRIKRHYSVFTDLYFIEVPPDKQVAESINILEHNPSVRSVDANHLYFADATPNDSDFGKQWALNNTGQDGGVPDADVNAPEAWEQTTGSDTVVIAVLDTGVDYKHADLAANIWNNPGEILPDDGKDDDGNGFVDDVHGINAIANTGDPMDDNDHGTWVAGIIGAVGNNNTLISGVLWHTKILACKVLDENGVGDEASVITCLNYVAELSIKKIPIAVINASWGSTQQSSAFKSAIEALQDLGILYVAAAGNDGLDIDNNPYYPSSYSLANVLSVGATDSRDQRMALSNLGRHTVHVMAPGDGILTLKRGGGTETRSGTSFSAPHVTALLALLKAGDPTLSWIQLRNLLLTGGDSVSAARKTVSGRRVRASDINGMGSMTCKGEAVQARLQPAEDYVVIAKDSTLQLAAINLLCAVPNGVMTVSVTPDDATITLNDNGTDSDQVSGDGVYSATWKPPGSKIYVLTFPNADQVTVEVQP